MRCTGRKTRIKVTLCIHGLVRFRDVGVKGIATQHQNAATWTATDRHLTTHENSCPVFHEIASSPDKQIRCHQQGRHRHLPTSIHQRLTCQRLDTVHYYKATANVPAERSYLNCLRTCQCRRVPITDALYSVPRAPVFSLSRLFLSCGTRCTGQHKVIFLH